MSMSVGTHYSSNYVGIALVNDNAYSIWGLGIAWNGIAIG